LYKEEESEELIRSIKEKELQIAEIRILENSKSIENSKIL
jgi:hypothetical protein